MNFEELKFDRFGYKSKQKIGTVSSSESSSNNKGTVTSPEDNSIAFFKAIREAKQVVTGTVITNCIIQTSGLPYRVEISENDIFFLDDTYVENGVIKGNTSTLVFTHDIDKTEGFFMEKRGSINNTYDNVLSWYATPAKNDRYNYMFIGRNGLATNPQRNVHSMHFNVDLKSTGAASLLNGVFEIEYSVDGVSNSLYKLLAAGDTRSIIDPSGTGTSIILNAGDGGYSGLSYEGNVGIYIHSLNEVTLGLNFIPDADNTYDIGSPTKKIKDIHIGGKLNVGKVNSAGMTIAGTVGDIVFNTNDSKFYGCTVTGTPGTWVAFH